MNESSSPKPSGRSNTASFCTYFVGADKVLSIPESAIEFSGDSTFVYVVKGEGKNKTYDRTYVETGLSDGVNIEIKKGITAKDKVRGPEIVTDDKEK